MAEELVMPRLSDTMERGTIARWLKAEGDAVARGRRARRDRDRQGHDGAPGLRRRRAAADPRRRRRVGRPRRADRPHRRRGGEEVPAAGGATAATAEERRRRRPPSETARVPDGRGARGDAPQPPTPAPQATSRAGRAADGRPRPATGAAQGQPGRARASPTRPASTCAAWPARAAGPDGRIVRVDVERADRSGSGRRDRAAAEPPPQAAPRPPRPQPGAAARGRRRSSSRARCCAPIARRMGESKATGAALLPHGEIDMGKALALREELNAALAGEGDQGHRQRPDRARLRAGAARPPAVPPLVGRTASSSTTRSERRHRRRPRRRPDRARRPRRRVDDARARSPSTRATSPSAHGPVAEAARDRGRHVHRLQPRHVRHHALRGDHQPARARHPRRRRDVERAIERRRPGRRAPDHERHALRRPPGRIRCRRRALPAVACSAISEHRCCSCSSRVRSQAWSSMI